MDMSLFMAHSYSDLTRLLPPVGVCRTNNADLRG